MNLNLENIPSKARIIVEDHIRLLDKKLPNIIGGYFIYGSISLGEFNDVYSDIDFYVIMNREISNNDIATLQGIHKELRKTYLKVDIEGRYVSVSDIKEDVDKVSCLRFLEGEYIGIEEFDKNSIDAFQIKKYGIQVRGNKEELLNYTVDFDILIQNMVENLNTYWSNWKSGGSKLLSKRGLALLFDLKSIEWGVLGVTRLYYTIREKDIVSKLGAGEYALKNLPRRWNSIINEAMGLRKGDNMSYYKSIITRRKDALEYMNFIIKECNELYSLNNSDKGEYYEQ